MPDACCSHPGNDAEFDAHWAARTARRVRRRGLLGREQRVLERLQRAVDPSGAAVLEIGGGLGQLQLALLDAGAATATNVELSPHYETEARRLAAARGHTDRIARRVDDATDPATTVPRADIAIAFRVLCCTDGWRGLLDTLVRAQPHTIVLTLPRDGLLPGLAIATDNAISLLRRSDYRMRHHRVTAIVERLGRAGYTPTIDARDLYWQTLILTQHDVDEFHTTAGCDCKSLQATNAAMWTGSLALP